MFELMMVEWHVTPDYVVNNWTEELFSLMIEKLIKRSKRISGTIPNNTVSAELLAARSRGMIEVKHGD